MDCDNSNYVHTDEEQSKTSKNKPSVRIDDNADTQLFFSPGVRWKNLWALLNISFIGFFTMICYDLPGSLEWQIQEVFSVETYTFEFLYSLACFPNIVLAFFDGILIDRVLGVKTASFLVAGIVLVGQIIFTIGGFAKSFWVLLLARFIFGLGCDSLLVICNYYSVLWFSGKGLNFVFGIVMSTARLGSSFVFLIAAPLYNSIYHLKADHVSIGFTFAICVVSGLLILLSAIAVAWFSQKNGKLNMTKKDIKPEPNLNKYSKFRQLFVYPFKFWLVTVIFISLQTTVLAFVTCAQQLLMDKYKVSLSTSNSLGSVFNLVLSLSSPFAGIIIDRIGNNLSIIIGSFSVAVISQLLIAFVDSNPYLPLMLFGLSSGTLYSSVLPLTPLVVPPTQLGAAFGLSVSLSDLSLTVFNILAGYLLDKYGHSATAVFYAVLLFIGLISSIALWISDWRNNGVLNNNQVKIFK